MGASPAPSADAAVAVVGEVPWIAAIGGDIAHEIVDAGDEVTFRAGQPIVAELEVGDAMFFIVSGEAKVTVNAGEGELRELNVLRRGDTCGEIALLTRGLRSASVTAATPVKALRMGRREFERLLARYPAAAIHFARAVAARLAATREALQLLLHPHAAATTAVDLAGQSSAVLAPKPSLRRAWRELVIGRRRELPFIALVAFVGTLAIVRGGAWLVEHTGASLFAYLRGAYILGFALLLVSTAASLVRFRPAWQRAVAASLGIGFALILNELSVFLAFDIFYVDMTHADPNMAFDVETLYRRSESQRAITVMAAFLLQLVVLRRFFRRIFFVLRARAARLFARR